MTTRHTHWTTILAFFALFALSAPLAAQEEPEPPAEQTEGKSESAGENESENEDENASENENENESAGEGENESEDESEKPAKKTSKEPTLYHVPSAQWPAGAKGRFQAEIESDWKLQDVWLAIRPLNSDGEFQKVAFKRSSTANAFQAIVPGERMQPPGVEYYIGSKAEDGETRSHFASADSPHPVIISGETDLTKMRARLERHDGNRSQFTLRGDYTTYGRRQFERRTASGTETAQTDRFTDFYWTTELEYRYRFLTWLYDISFGLGFMRGQHATAEVDGETITPDIPESRDVNDPGMNYGFGQATAELHRNFSLEAKLILGASDVGFAAGVGGLIRIGRIAGTRLEIGGETVQDIGGLTFFRFAWDTVPRVPMSLTIEINDRPDTELSPTGTRLIYDVGYEFSDAFEVTGRVGYAARTSGLDAGFVGGLDVSYAF